MAQAAPAEVLPAAEEVQHLTGEHVLHQGVDGEIPAAGGSLRPQPRVHLHGEVPVAPAHGSLPPWHGDVQSAACQSVDAKAGPHRPTAAHPVQHDLQLLGGDAVDLDIQILALPAQQAVPDAAAHIVDAAAQRLHLLCDAAGRLTILCHAVSPPCEKSRGHGPRLFCSRQNVPQIVEGMGIGDHHHVVALLNDAGAAGDDDLAAPCNGRHQHVVL